MLTDLLPAASQLVSLNFSFKEKQKAVKFSEEQGELIGGLNSSDEELEGYYYMWTDYCMNYNSSVRAELIALSPIGAGERSGSDPFD